MSFTNQVALITGASSGIGSALARELAREGCKVGLVARRQELLAELVRDIEQAGGAAVSAAADVADREATRKAIDDVAAQLGPVDLLVANAGLGAPTTLEPMNVGVVEKMVRVNLLGVVYAIEAVLPSMLQRGRGHLAAVSSMAAFRGLPGDAGYCASKAAVNVYLDSLRLQLRSRGVAVTTICPGFVKTPMTAGHRFRMPWLMEPEYAARQIVRGLRQRRTMCAFPWQLALIARLSRWLPDWFVAWRMRHYAENRDMSRAYE
jgi:short-subunit dehydrogenase